MMTFRAARLVVNASNARSSASSSVRNGPAISSRKLRLLWNPIGPYRSTHACNATIRRPNGRPLSRTVRALAPKLTWSG